MKKLINLVKMQYNSAFAIKKYLIYMLVVSLFLMLSDSSFIIFSALMIMLGLTYTTECYEEKSKQANLIYTLPVKPQMYIFSKYIYGYINLLISMAVLFCVYYGGIKLNLGNYKALDLGNITAVLIAVGVFIVTVVVPIAMIFGFEKVRFILIGMIVLITGAGQFVINNFSGIKFIFFNKGCMIFSVICVGVIASLISYYITSFFYLQKDK